MKGRRLKLNQREIEESISQLLRCLGQNVEAEGFRDTPRRVAEMYLEQCNDERDGLDRVFVAEKYDELVLVRNIPISSFCQHHLLPWFGRAHIAYIPQEKLLGISKLARLAYSCAKGFTIQEGVTSEIAQRLVREVNPLGCMVVIEAVHACMSLRGAKAIGASTITSSVSGVFREKPAARHECLSLIRGDNVR